MRVKLDSKTFDLYLKELANEYKVFGPVLKEGKGKFAETNVVGYGEILNATDIVWDEKSYFSPKEIFYPVRETLFYFNKNEIEIPEVNETLNIVFLRPCDLNGVKRLDTLFLENGSNVDPYYKRRRDMTKFVVMTCDEGFDTCFCVSMGANEVTQYDGLVQREGEAIYLEIVDDALWNGILKSQENADFTPQFVQENKVKVEIPDVESVTKEVFNHTLWTEYTSRCIACGRCNTSCITCSCFTMQDVALSDNRQIGERRRVWASCHVDGYTDMAGGHTFRSKNGDRMRFKTMHKINDFYRRFGMHMCVGCGRCDDVCPEYISFSKCINKLNTIIKEENNNA